MHTLGIRWRLDTSNYTGLDRRRKTLRNVHTICRLRLIETGRYRDKPRANYRVSGHRAVVAEAVFASRPQRVTRDEVIATVVWT